MTNISNHPLIVEVKRNADVTVFTDNRQLQEIEITCLVTHYNSLNEDVRGVIAPRQVVLKATMQNFVDDNGDYAETGTPEYLYWKNVITSGAIDEDTLYRVVIQKADANLRFN